MTPTHYKFLATYLVGAAFLIVVQYVCMKHGLLTPLTAFLVFLPFFFLLSKFAGWFSSRKQ